MNRFNLLLLLLIIILLIIYIFKNNMEFFTNILQYPNKEIEIHEKSIKKYINFNREDNVKKIKYVDKIIELIQKNENTLSDKTNLLNFIGSIKVIIEAKIECKSDSPEFNCNTEYCNNHKIDINCVLLDALSKIIGVPPNKIECNTIDITSEIDTYCREVYKDFKSKNYFNMRNNFIYILDTLCPTKNENKYNKIPCVFYNSIECPTGGKNNRCEYDYINNLCIPSNKDNDIHVIEDCESLSPYGKKYCTKYNNKTGSSCSWSKTKCLNESQNLKCNKHKPKNKLDCKQYGDTCKYSSNIIDINGNKHISEICYDESDLKNKNFCLNFPNTDLSSNNKLNKCNKTLQNNNIVYSLNSELDNNNDLPCSLFDSSKYYYNETHNIFIEKESRIIIAEKDGGEQIDELSYKKGDKFIILEELETENKYKVIGFINQNILGFVYINDSNGIPNFKIDTINNNHSEKIIINNENLLKDMCENTVDDNDLQKCKYISHKSYNNKHINSCLPKNVKLESNFIFNKNDCNSNPDYKWSDINNQCINLNGNCNNTKNKYVCNLKDNCLWQNAGIQYDEERGYCKDFDNSELEKNVDNYYEIKRDKVFKTKTLENNYETYLNKFIKF
jgi:hypothetical protein